MGLDIYAGTLTRYYSGNWELVSQQIAKQLGVAYTRITPEGENEPIQNPKEIAQIQEIVQNWQSLMYNQLPQEYREPLWDENIEKDYFTENIGHEPWIALSIVKIATLLNKPFPKTICGDSIAESPLLKYGEEDDEIRTSLLNVQLWLPFEQSYKLSFVDPKNENAMLATISYLENELKDLNNAIWKADEPTILSWQNEENLYPLKDSFLAKLFNRKKAPIYDTESLAKYAYSIIYRTIKFAKQNNVPIVLDF